MRKETTWIDNSRLAVFDFGDILDEDLRQIEKWGIQTHDPYEWMNHLTEEVGELAAAISDCIYQNHPKEEIKKEAIQVATLALKIAKMSAKE